MDDQNLVLLIEDNEDDQQLTRRALRKNNVNNEVVVAIDGTQALDYLFGRGEYEGKSVPLPALVVLDLQIPKTSGLEVLRQIRASERTRLIPVVVLTGEENPQAILDCYEAGANSYVLKPKSAEEYSDQILTMAMYWLLLNRPCRAAASR